MSETTSRRIRILIVDDHPVVRAGLANMLETRENVEVVGSVWSGQEAFTIIERCNPDLLLLDMRMPGLSGIQVLEHLRTLVKAPRVLIFTNFETDEDVYRAVRAGAHGYLLKNTTQDEMIAAIEAVAAGRRYFPAQISARLAQRKARTDLTTRELEILELMSKGLTNKQIGVALAISEITARNHVNKIIEKLEVSDRTEAVAMAFHQGLLDIQP